MKLSLPTVISMIAFSAFTPDAATADRVPTSADVVLYGATPPGIAAALSAAEGNLLGAAGVPYRL